MTYVRRSVLRPRHVGSRPRMLGLGRGDRSPKRGFTGSGVFLGRFPNTYSACAYENQKLWYDPACSLDMTVRWFTIRYR